MIVSFSGAQSTGKTTLLNKIRGLNPFGIEYVDEVTRRIKRDFNLPINESGGDLTQTMIMSDHIANVYRKGDHDVTVLDRCAVDGVVYTQWLKQQDQVKEGTYLTAVNVFNDLISKYDIIFYTSPEDVPLEDDGERSINVKFRDEIIHLFKIYMSNLDNVITLRGTVEERLITIKNTLALHNIDINI